MTEPARAIVLVWPDAGQPEDEARAALRGVEAELVVATWDAGAEDGGRTDLLLSVREARERITARGADPEKLVLVGFGRGAIAAAGLRRYAKRLGLGLGTVLCVAPQWDEPDPFSGAPLGEIPERIELVPRVVNASAALAAALIP